MHRERQARVVAERPRRHAKAVAARHQSVPVAVGNGIVHSVSGATAHVAAGATAAFQCLVTALDNAGYPIRFMGGWRAHGSVPGSLHPAGLALDVNQLSRNVTRPHMPSNEIELANACGLVSGAQWAHGDSGPIAISNALRHAMPFWDEVVEAVNEGIPLVRGAARTAIAERFAQIASLAFSSQAAPTTIGVAPAADDRRQTGRFGRRR